jgi:hypothetical protein
MAEETAPGMTRREAMLQLLRVGGVAAGAAGAASGSASAASARSGAGRAGAARPSHGASAADAQWPQMTVVQGGEPRAWFSRRLKIWAASAASSAAGRGGAQAQHRLGPHAGAGRQHQSRSGCRSGAAVLAGGRQARHRHRRELQRAAPLLSALRHSGRRARRGR